MDALLDEEAEEAERLEAAEVLGEVVALASDDNWAVPAALRRSRLLSELGEFELADRTWNEIAVRVEDSPAWEPEILAERIQSLLDREDRGRATAFSKTLSAKYPDHDLTKKLALSLSGTQKEEP